MALSLLALLVTDCASTKVIVKNPERLNTIKNVAVLPFECGRPDVGITIADSLTAQLMESRFQIIERSQLDEILMEQGLGLSDLIESQQYMVGEAEGIDALIVGNAIISYGFADVAYGGNIGYVSWAEAKIIDSRTGEVLMAVTFAPSAASTQAASTRKGVINATEVGYWMGREIIKKLNEISGLISSTAQDAFWPFPARDSAGVSAETPATCGMLPRFFLPFAGPGPGQKGQLRC